MQTTLIVVFSYLVGAISTAVLVSRLMALPDPRTGGSGNPGATNVLRLGGKKAGALTLLGDVLKGVLPVLIAKQVSDSDAVVVGAAVAAFLGHLYPVFLSFKGGKGAATALGVVAALSWPVGLAISATWLLVATVSRYSSLASILAALTAPLYATWIGQSIAVVLGMIVMSALLIMRHQANIARLVAGNESKIGASSS